MRLDSQDQWWRTLDQDDSAGAGDAPAAGDDPGAQGGDDDGGAPGDSTTLLSSDDDDGHGPGEQPKGETPTGDGAPEEFGEFTLPEGMTVDQLGLEEATPLMRELGLDQDKAQKVVDAFVGRVKAWEENAQQALLEQRKEWRKATMEHAEIGGDKMSASKSAATAFIRRVMSGEGEAQAFMAMLDQTGAGERHELITLLARAQAAVSEDSFGGKATGAGKQAPKTLEEKFYGASPAPAGGAG